MDEQQLFAYLSEAPWWGLYGWYWVGSRAAAYALMVGHSAYTVYRGEWHSDSSNRVGDVAKVMGIMVVPFVGDLVLALFLVWLGQYLWKEGKELARRVERRADMAAADISRQQALRRRAAAAASLPQAGQLSEAPAGDLSVAEPCVDEDALTAQIALFEEKREALVRQREGILAGRAVLVERRAAEERAAARGRPPPGTFSH